MGQRRKTKKNKNWEGNENAYRTQPNVRDVARAVLRGQLIVLNKYYQNRKKKNPKKAII